MKFLLPSPAPPWWVSKKSIFQQSVGVSPIHTRTQLGGLGWGAWLVLMLVCLPGPSHAVMRAPANATEAVERLVSIVTPGATLEAGPLHLVFERRLVDNPSGLEIVARQELWVGEGRVRLDTQIVGGQGQSSIALLLPQGSWLLTPGGWQPVDTEQLARRLEEVLPKGFWPMLVRWSSGLPPDVAGGVLEGGEEGNWSIIGKSGTRIDWIGLAEHPVRIAVPDGGGLLEWVFSDWMQVQGVAVPRTTTHSRGGQVLSRIDVVSLDLPRRGKDQWFSREGLELPQPAPASPE